MLPEAQANGLNTKLAFAGSVEVVLLNVPIYNVVPVNVAKLGIGVPSSSLANLTNKNCLKYPNKSVP